MSDFLSHLVTRSLDLAPRAAAPIVRPRLPSRFEARIDPVSSDLGPLTEETTERSVATEALSSGLPRAEPRDLLPRREPKRSRVPTAASPEERSRSARPLSERREREEPERAQDAPRPSLRPPGREDDEVTEPSRERARSVEPASRPSPRAASTPGQTPPRVEPVVQRIEEERAREPQPPRPASPPAGTTRREQVKLASDPAPVRTLLQPRVERVETEAFPNLRDEPPPEPVIQVTIGRVEVRATPAPKPRPRERAAASSAVDLGEYLRQRARGERR